MAIKLFFYIPPIAYFLIVAIQIIAYTFLFFGGKSLQKTRDNFFYSYLFKIISVIGIIALVIRVILSIVYFTNGIVFFIYFIVMTLIFAAIGIVLLGIIFIWIGYKNKNSFGRYIVISGVFYIAFMSSNTIVYFFYLLILRSFDLIELYFIRAFLSFLYLFSCVSFLFFAFKINKKNLKISTIIFLLLSIYSTLSAFVSIYYFIAYNA